MDTKALKKLNNEDLQKRLVDKVKEYSQKIFDRKLGKDNDFSGAKMLRREIARIKTLINENKDK